MATRIGSSRAEPGMQSSSHLGSAARQLMVGGAVSAFYGGLHYWWPKMTGRLYPDTWARFAAILMFFGFAFTFTPMFIMGFLGMPRRYYSYPAEFQIWHVLASSGALILAVAYLLPMAYLAWSLIWGRRAGRNPWQATGLEWRTSSPPPKHDFDTTPVVTEAPYAYRPASISSAVVEAWEATQ